MAAPGSQAATVLAPSADAAPRAFQQHSNNTAFKDRLSEELKAFDDRFTTPLVLYICTYYKRAANLSLICDAMRRMPNADPLIVCNGNPRDLEDACKGIPVAVQNNKWKCLGRHLEARKLLEEKDYAYILNTDDDVIAQPALTNWLLAQAGGDKKTIVSCWGHRLRPPFDDYWDRIRVTDLTECHYGGAQVILYPADFIRELPLDEITEDMIDMDDVWMSHQAIRLGYRQLGAPGKHWEARGMRDEHALYIHLGHDRKKRYWNKLFGRPEFVRKYRSRMESIWAQQGGGEVEWE